MNLKIIIGLCIAFALVTTIANAQQYDNTTLLNNLLNQYRSSYDDGSFTVIPSGQTCTAAIYGSEAGNLQLQFNISGPGTNTNDYAVLATLDIDTDRWGFLGGKQVQEENVTSHTGIHTANFMYDGNYYLTDFAPYYQPQLTFKTKVKIFQAGIEKYENTFDIEAIKDVPVQPDCFTYGILFDSATSEAPLPVNVINDPRFDYLNLTLYLTFGESKTYKVGAYIWDNISASAFAEIPITVTANSNTPVTLSFDSSKLRDFKLNNQPILLRSIVVDGHVIDQPWNIDYYNTWDHPNLPTFTTSQFDPKEISITSYTFDTSKQVNGKITELGITLNTQNATGTYDVALSLENQYNQMINVTQESVSSWPHTFWFNGTDIYQSKINGPYRIGSIHISKSNQRLLYAVDTAVSGDLAYSNFTAPPLPDLNINDQDIQGDDTDINVTIHNNGTGDAAGVVISLFNSVPEKVAEVIVDSIKAGDSYQHNFTGINLSGAFAFIDFENQVEESNESNNIAELKAPFIAPAKIESVQPTAATISFTDGQSIQFNATTNGTQPITYQWILNNSIVSTGANYIFAPDYYAEGSKLLKLNVSNANGSQIHTWNINVTPGAMGIFAYVYNQTAMNLGNRTAINANMIYTDLVFPATAAEIPASYAVPLNTEVVLNFTATGFLPLTKKLFLDSRLFTCTEGSNCAFTNTYNTNCVWESSSWSCSNTKSGVTDYFRLFTNPKRVKLVAFMTES